MVGLSRFDFRCDEAQNCSMKKTQQSKAGDEFDAALLKRELERGLASGIGKRTPAQIRADFRRAREAA